MIFLPQVLELSDLKMVKTLYRKGIEEQKTMKESILDIERQLADAGAGIPNPGCQGFQDRPTEAAAAPAKESTGTPSTKKSTQVIIIDKGQAPRRPSICRVNVDPRPSWLKIAFGYTTVLFFFLLALFMLHALQNDIGTMRSLRGTHTNVNINLGHATINLDALDARISSAHANFTKKYHVMVEEKMNWTAAEKFCRANDMRLAIVDNKEKNQRVSQLIKSMGNEKKNESFWLGGLYLCKETFAWVQFGDAVDLEMDKTPPAEPDTKPKVKAHSLRHPTTTVRPRPSQQTSAILPKPATHLQEVTEQYLGHQQSPPDNEVLPTPMSIVKEHTVNPGMSVTPGAKKAGTNNIEEANLGHLGNKFILPADIHDDDEPFYANLDNFMEDHDAVQVDLIGQPHPNSGKLPMQDPKPGHLQDFLQNGLQGEDNYDENGGLSQMAVSIHDGKMSGLEMTEPHLFICEKMN